MKITIGRIVREFGEIALEPENQAEQYQLNSIMNKSLGFGIHCKKWDDGEGRNGICLRLVLDEKKEVEG